MSDSQVVMSADFPLRAIRRNKRVYVTLKGKLYEPDNTQATADGPKAAKNGIGWDIWVVDTSTQERIDAYPRMSERDQTILTTVEDAAMAIYYHRLTIMDGEKPDVDLLTKKIDAGDWELHIELEPQQPQ